MTMPVTNDPTLLRTTYSAFGRDFQTADAAEEYGREEASRLGARTFAVQWNAWRGERMTAYFTERLIRLDHEERRS